MKLPKISSPTFSGKYDEWIPFHDLFKSTVDSNRSLSNIQKLHYLKSSLKEEPARLLAHLPISNSNYEVATKLLENRYANKRMITQTHLGAIFNFKPIKMESADQLRKLVATYVENTMALEAVGLDNSSSDFIWLYLIGQKLDSETRRQWELHLKRDEEQTMGEFIKFLEDRARALEFSNQSSSTEKLKFSRDKSEKREIQVYHQKSEISSACSKCSQKHAIYMCNEFKNLSIDDKVQVVESKNLCFNCLKSGHSSKDCNSKSACRTRKKRGTTRCSTALQVHQIQNRTPNPIWVMGDTVHVISPYSQLPS